MLIPRNIIYIFLIWNVIVAFLYWIDKKKAEKGAYRISEKTLILSAFLMGAPGALCGMHFFRHKTKHMSFLISIPLALVVNIAVVYFIYFR